MLVQTSHKITKTTTVNSEMLRHLAKLGTIYPTNSYNNQQPFEHI
jgi:methyltransferase-like protein